jgi:hypothetical protein
MLVLGTISDFPSTLTSECIEFGLASFNEAIA